MNGTILTVVENEFCTGCGTCVSICPNEAIKMIKNDKKSIYLPKLNEDKCNNCGICFKACPGHEVDLKGMNLEIFGKKPDNVLIGNYLNCYIGHATDYDIRYNSSSGGLVTALMVFALEEGLVDGVLVTRMKKDNPLEPESFIARTKEEVIEASKSKYCPVPANIALKEILELKDNEKIAIVGLPCHISGIRKAEQINKKLKERIALHVGIFCAHSVNFLGTEFLLNKLRIKKEDVKKINYRGEGWPGRMLIELNNGNKKVVNYPLCWNSLFALYFFTPARCLLCSDAICELADISFGDAWLPELSDDKIGKSIIVSKNETSEKLLQMMELKNKIKLSKISAEKVVQSQKITLYFKKKISKANINKNKLSSDNLLETDFIDYLIILFQHLNNYMSSNSFLRGLLRYIPLKIIWLYGAPFMLICSKKSRRDFNIFLNRKKRI